MNSNESSARPYWAAARWVLLAVWVVAAIADVMRLPAGFLTNQAADLTFPAWMYIVLRARRPSFSMLNPTLLRSSPWLTGGILFVGCAGLELSQYFWPHGFLPGTFDPLDILAYAAGIGGCVACDVVFGGLAAPRGQAQAGAAALMEPEEGRDA